MEGPRRLRRAALRRGSRGLRGRGRARLLLDTQVLIWWDADTRLSRKAADAIREAEQVYVSAAGAWEIAIKASLGKLETTRRFADAVAESGFEELPVRIAHAEAVQGLPWHHRDPFDRLIVAQAEAEGLILGTRDQVFGPYGPRTLKA